MKVNDLTTPLHEARQSMAGQDYNTRVNAGKKMEAAIIQKLREKGLKVRPASRREDMYDKIDLWVTIQGKEQPTQIKQREVGDDVIFEIYKDTNSRQPNGRDFIGKAVFYVAVDTKGQGFVVFTKSLKDVAMEYVDQFGAESGEYKGATFKATRDQRSGNPKLMGFFPPSKYGKRIF